MHTVIEHAMLVAKSGGESAYGRRDYEDAMLELAKAEARPGESPEVAFVRLLQDREPRMEALAKAGQMADIAERQAAAEKWREDTASGKRGEDIRKRTADREAAGAQMEKYAAASARDGETPEQAMTRMLCEDETMQTLYRQYEGS